MTNVKGTAILATVRYLGETFGPRALGAILAELAPDERRCIEDGLLASAWYPFPLLLKLMRLANDHHGLREPDLCRSIGRASADYSLKGIYRVFFKLGSPEFVIAKASTVMKTYYSTGDMQVVVSEKGHAVVQMEAFADPAVELCQRLEGWMQRTLELSGGKDVRLTHDRCVNRGDPFCRFDARWT